VSKEGLFGASSISYTISMQICDGGLLHKTKSSTSAVQ
jgi:hypothetical protein